MTLTIQDFGEIERDSFDCVITYGVDPLLELSDLIDAHGVDDDISSVLMFNNLLSLGLRELRDCLKRMDKSYRKQHKPLPPKPKAFHNEDGSLECFGEVVQYQDQNPNHCTSMLCVNYCNDDLRDQCRVLSGVIKMDIDESAPQDAATP